MCMCSCELAFCCLAVAAGLEKNLEFQLALGLSSSQILLAPGKL